MGFLRAVFNTGVAGGVGVAGGWAIFTRNSKFVPVSPSDPILASPAYLQSNPNRNPIMHDRCVRKVRLSTIQPRLLEKEGRLVEAFCAGLWSGPGYQCQRAYLARKYQSTTADQLWSREELRDSNYDVGTQFTDHFQVLSKTPETIVMRCGDSPLNGGLRDSDGLVQIGAVINREEDVVELSFTSVFYQGLGVSTEKPQSEPIEFAHRLYTKLLIETAVPHLVM